MAHIQDRGKDVERRWQARYRDPDGNERTKSFRRKGDAQRWIDEQTADMLTGRYVDPAAGRVTVETFARRWLETQTFDPSTREAVESRLRGHVFPHLGGAKLRSLRPSSIQGWLRRLQQDLAPRTVRTTLVNLSSILSAAVEDGLIVTNPCASSAVSPPKAPRERVVPWSREQVAAVVEAHPGRYRAIPVVAAGCGLRQGEVFGLRLDDVDFLKRRLLVRRQVKIVRSRLVLAPPKGGKEREVPLPDAVAVELAERLRHYGSGEVELPWREPAGEAATAQLVFVSRESGALNRNHYNSYVWRRALSAAGLEPRRSNGMHALRHHYASVLLDGGVSIRAVADYLGHADPGFTLRTYAHLMPNSEERARAVVDAAFSSGAGAPAESPRNGMQGRE